METPVPSSNPVGGPLSSARTTGIIVAAFAAGFVMLGVWSGSLYETLKAAHVLLAIVWVGGGLMIQLLAFRILRESDGERIGRFARDVDAVTLRAFVPSSLLLVLIGFWLMHDGGWAFSFWIVAALVAWAFSFVTGAAFLGPESGRVGKLIAQRGGVDAEIRQRIERLLFISRVELAVIALVAVDMVLKPGA